MVYFYKKCIEINLLVTNCEYDNKMEKHTFLFNRHDFIVIVFPLPKEQIHQLYINHFTE